MNYQRPQRVIRISKKKLLITLVVIVVGVWVVSNMMSQGVGLSEESITAMPDSPATQRGIIAPYPPYYDQDTDISDTREFLKTNYNGTIFSRTVQDTVDEVENAVRSVDGRIDGITSNERYGNVSFAIPKSNLSEFKDEIEQITHKKLIIESISSTNLLGQKQNIEDRTEDAVITLGELEESKQELDAAHASKLSALQGQVNTLQSRLDEVRKNKIAEMGASDEEKDDDKVEQLVSEETSLIQQIVSLQNDQTNENSYYYQANKNLSARINDAGGNVEDLAEEDVDFMNNIETVNGRVSIQWISYWEMAERFSPTPMWANTLVVILIVWWILHRRRMVPKLQLV